MSAPVRHMLLAALVIGSLLLVAPEPPLLAALVIGSLLLVAPEPPPM